MEVVICVQTAELRGKTLPSPTAACTFQTAVDTPRLEIIHLSSVIVTYS